MEKTDIPRTFILVIYFNKHLKQDAFSWHNIQLSGNMIQFKSYKKKTTLKYTRILKVNASHFHFEMVSEQMRKIPRK